MAQHTETNTDESKGWHESDAGQQSAYQRPTLTKGPLLAKVAAETTGSRSPL